MFTTQANEIDATVNSHAINKPIDDKNSANVMMSAATVRHCQTLTNELNASVAVDVEGDEHYGRHRQTIDENYVCDISMMKIDDKQVGAATTLQLGEDYDDVDDVDDVDEDDIDGSADVSNVHDMPSEVVFDRQLEEQTITELVHASSEVQLMEAANNGRMRVVFGILVRLVLPLAHGVARSFKGIRDARLLRALRNLAASRQALTNLVAFAANTISLNLSSVQVTNRIGPLLQVLKLRKSRDGFESLPDTLSIGGVDGSSSLPTTPTTPIVSPTMSPFLREARGSLPMLAKTAKRRSTVSEAMAPNCCTLNILAAPPADVPIRADIVFIHGLHGSQVNTWKQGLWENERHPVEFERPPRPPVRPPKRPRHSRTSTMHQPPQQKRARFARQERQYSEPDLHADGSDFDCQTQTASFADYSYVCGEPEDIQICEGIEYSFPTFRLRMNEQSRLLQAGLATMLNNENANTTNDQSTKASKQSKRKQSAKPSPDDPNYSKCWPGDWLPMDCPGVRVIAVNYTTDQYLWRPLWKSKEPRSNLVQRAREMAEQLIKHRVGYGHPIVYVGHSKGGLFIKQIIVDAWESGRPAMTPLWRSARGVFFYSVPHRGSHLASIKAPLLTRSVELLEIEKNNKYLLDLHKRFAGLYDMGHLKIEVFSFVETALTLMSVLYLRIVGVDSADPGIGDVCGIRLDHREICKPRSRDCILYKELVKMIKKVC